MRKIRKIIVFIAKSFVIGLLYLLALVSFGCLVTGMGIMDVKGLYGIDTITMFFGGRSWVYGNVLDIQSNKKVVEN